ncbi:sugar-binding protein [Actinomadura spongiicola]|uniref:Sugar-binding protein n=1 Tax=Actinomadura spongiicola TaxID=2303421 RepID=A0A372G9C4_9ACTN|nr:SpvB/TcaC N-terminal domain-containing protein [Actinomadura spongiicola]RFS81971.1 sugar-binding protein [Actinomadura spongiicola]
MTPWRAGSDADDTGRSGAEGPPRTPVISTPKGGGAIRDLGETFAANPANGTGTLTIPIPISPARQGFAPALALGYDSGAGGGVFGLGWRLDVPAVTRRTDRGVPRYRDSGPPGEEDTFQLLGGDDLVPVPGTRRVERAGRRYAVRRYRPRADQAFSRIERWTDGTGDIHWRVTGRDNVTTVFGRTPGERIADPSDPARVFTWLASASFDGRGNATRYEYKAEDAAGVDVTAPHENGRDPAARTVARHLKRVRYGNLIPLSPDERRSTDWMFELVLDYGEHGDTGEEERSWTCRPDPFSSYRSGFEVRTYRLCRRVLLLHHFPDEPGADGLVQSLDLTYDVQRPSGLTTLASVTGRGFRNGTARAMPPVEFTYAPAEIGDEVRVLDDTENLPAGVTTPAYRWTDLDGDGLPGILTEQAGALFYKANLGSGRFAPLRAVDTRPVPSGLGGGRRELLDLDGDGTLDLVAFDGPVPGFSERADGTWTSWRPFGSRPVLDWQDARTRLVDLSGDGLADVLVLGDDDLTWHRSLGEDGFDEAIRAAVPCRADGWLHPSDPVETVQFADMTGDGLADLVRVRDGEVSYWPSLGHGRFGRRIVMDGAPLPTGPDTFDPRRVILADVDGSGTSDLIYLGADGVRLYANRSGNGWAPAEEIPVRFPRIDSAIQVGAVDLLGTGTLCLVWSSPLPGDGSAPLRYVDLMRAGKPYLLTGTRNNLGSETTVTYTTSTRFSTADRAAGRPWPTKLPFPVHVVERVETRDAVSRNVFTTRYAYHDGHYDGVEREFGGFGMVEQWDTEEIGALVPSGAAASNHDPATVIAPVLVRSWFHTGAPGGATSRVLVREPGGPPRPARLTPDEERQAARVLRGSLLRQETYGLDGTPESDRPYSVVEHAYTVELRQAGHGSPRGDGHRPAVFTSYLTESHEEHHERVRYRVDGREVADPRVQDEFVLDVGEYGDVLRAVAVAYGRRHPDPDPVLTAADRAEQARTRVLVTEQRYTHAIDTDTAYRTPLPCEKKVTEVVGRRPSGDRFTEAELRGALDAVTADLPVTAWDDIGADGPARRLLERERSLFSRDDLSGPLPFGAIEPLALPYETVRQILTDELLDAEYGDRVDAARLVAAGYVRDDGAWWAPSGRVLFTPEDGGSPADRFYLPHAFVDPFGATTRLRYDPYDLLVVSTTDAVGNVVSVGERDGDRVLPGGYDYRVLQPRVTCDANGNLTEAAYDALGRLTATAVRGKPGDDRDDLGDTVAGLDLDPTDEDLLAYFADPHRPGLAQRLLGRATSRTLHDPDAYHRTRDDTDPRPPATALLSRTEHVAARPPDAPTDLLQMITYSDGAGRAAQHKAQAEPDADGRPRWSGTGWTIHNNKGLPVREYEPFFSHTHAFEFARTVGVSDIVFYDPVGRAVATLRPDGAYAKVVFDPWRLITWDANDTVALRPDADPDVRGLVGRYLDGLDAAGTPWRTWYETRVTGELGEDEKDAAVQTLAHGGTPDRAWSDPLGRSFLTVRHDRGADGSAGDRYDRTLVRLDVQGRTREIRDPLGRAVTRIGYDMAGAVISSAGIDTGPGLVLHDVLGTACASWTARGHTFRTEYDPLHRPVRAFVAGPGIDGERVHQRVEYGENLPDAAARNLRTQMHRTYDGSGVVTHDRYDPEGNLAEATRQVVRDYREAPDWAGPVELEPERYTGRVAFDALQRPVHVTAPDGDTITAAYNPAGLLERLDTRPADGDPVPIVTGVEYNARGQRVTVEHGNGARTDYAYDPYTFLLRGIVTERDGDRLQDLWHVYDPSGNVTSVRDEAEQTLFFRNQVVRPGGRYRYDALYRLAEATGREHLAQAHGLRPPGPRRGGPPPLHPHDGGAMSRYTERYAYDPAGNLLDIVHAVADPATPGWTRTYRYDQDSLLEPGVPGNRLGAVNGDRLDHDRHGNATALPGLAFLDWDPEDRLHGTAHRPPDAGGGLLDATWSCYDSSGTRVRKVTDRPGPDGERIRVRDRLYLGPFEVFREYAPDGAVTLERTTLHVLDEDRRVALIEKRTRGDDEGPALLVRHQLDDHLGSPTLELDQFGRILTREEYHPYGGTAYEAVSPGARAAPKRYRFTGRERDPESGLQYHGARFYAPWLGRWISPDPAGPRDAPSPYVYVAANPVRLTDPSGHQGTPPGGNSIDDIFTFIRNQAGFEAGAERTLDFTRRGASPFGTAAHAKATDLLARLKAAESPFRGIERVYSEVRVVAGQIQQIGGTPGGPKGAHNLDLVAVKEGRSLTVGQQLTAEVAEKIGDIKYGGGTISQKYGVYGVELVTVNGRTVPGAVPVAATAAETGAAAEATAQAAAQTAAQAEAPAAKAAQAAAGAGESAAAAAPATAEVAATGTKAAAVGGEAATAAKAAGIGSRVAGGAARVLRAAAPALRVVGKVAGPVALAAGVFQAATAHTTAEKADAAVNVTSGALALSANPVTGIAAGGLVAGGYVGGKVEAAATERYGRTTGVAAGTIAGAATGAAIGAVVGSIVPVVGTGVGAAVGAAAGAVGGFIKSYWK